MTTAHPRQRLRFHATGAWPLAAEANVREVLRRLVGARTWTLGPPEISWSAGELSGSLALHCAYPPWNERLALETDEAELEQTRALINVLADASARLGVTVFLDLDGDAIGTIANGRPDRGVSEVLLAEWERITVERRRKAETERKP